MKKAKKERRKHKGIRGRNLGCIILFRSYWRRTPRRTKLIKLGW